MEAPRSQEQFQPISQTAISNPTSLEDITEEMLDRRREDEYLSMIRQLKLDLADKSNEFESMKIKLDETNREIGLLSNELNECKLTMFEKSENSNNIHEAVIKSKKLEEDYVKLMSDYLDLGEQNVQFQLKLTDSYLIKSNAINNYECYMSSGVIANDLRESKLELDQKIADLNLASARIRALEGDNVTKEKNITELRKTLDDAKVTHKHEITVLEEYILCLKNTISSYERTLASYIEPKV